MKLLPRTLFGQILAALLVGLVTVEAVGLWLVLDDRARMAERLLGIHAAQRLAGIIAIVDQADPDERARLVAALNVPPMNLALGGEWGSPRAETAVYASRFGRLLAQEPWQAPSAASVRDARAFVDEIAAELPHPLEVRVLSIKWWPPREPAATGPGGEAAGERLRLRRPLLSVVGQAHLSDGAVLTFRHSLPQQGLDWPLRLLGWLVALVVSVALLSAWTVRRLTHPLSALAEAATGLAKDLEQPPLPERGPQEVARAAAAFNAMQRDLKRYLETRAQALAGVSHDLRLPLTRIRLRIDRLADEALHAQIEGDLAEMDQMIGNTLEYLRAGGGSEKPARVDLDALLEGLAEDMQALGAAVRIEGAVGAPYLGRPLALRRCLGNLLDNARRYGGGAIDVRVAATAATVTIEIGDRGPGIPEDQLEKACEPYVRLEASRARHTGGTGLGLAIARNIARGHGGELALSRRPGGGLLARLTLARAAPSP